uniref:Uncharacterized protein n=1 Tax=Meloidogyne javanica TaxID=6303 RepID=A0A915M3W1_MELJA
MGLLIFFFLFVFVSTTTANEATINATTESSIIDINSNLVGNPLKTENGSVINLCAQHECYELLKRELDLVGNISKGERDCKAALVESESGHEFWKVFGIVYIRDIQRQSYLCAADCCKNLINQKEVAKCSEQCQDKLRKVFDKFDQESEAMNERKKYNRDYVKLNPSEKKEFDEGFTKCAVKCFEESTNDLTKLKEHGVAA